MDEFKLVKRTLFLYVLLCEGKEINIDDRLSLISYKSRMEYFWNNWKDEYDIVLKRYKELSKEKEELK